LQVRIVLSVYDNPEAKRQVTLIYIGMFNMLRIICREYFRVVNDNRELLMAKG
jgi:hypothetical protein